MPRQLTRDVAVAGLRMLRQAEALSLADKETRARQIIRDARARMPDGPAVVAFSGGRDSTVTAELVRRELGSDVLIMHVDTGLTAPAVADWVRAYAGDRLALVHPPRPLPETWRTVGALPIGAKMSTRRYRRANPELRISSPDCCRIHKAQPANAYMRETGARLLFYGARASDSHRHRFKLAYGGEIVDRGSLGIIAYPVLVWTPGDVLTWLDEQLPGYPVRYGRSEELGCWPCCVNAALPASTLARLRREDPARFWTAVREWSFGEDVLMLAYGLTRAGAQQLIARDGWEALAAAGAFDRIPRAQEGTR